MQCHSTLTVYYTLYTKYSMAQQPTNWQSSICIFMHLEESTVTCDASHDSYGVVTLQMNSKCHFLSIAHYLSNHFGFSFLYLSVCVDGRWLPILHFCYTQNWKYFCFCFTESAGICTNMRIEKTSNNESKIKEWIWLSTTVTNTKHRSQIKMIITAKVYLNACAFMCLWKCSTMSPTRKTAIRYNALKHKHT